MKPPTRRCGRNGALCRETVFSKGQSHAELEDLLFPDEGTKGAD